jgi:predicted nuclease of predicted toxin-antitoxin system
MRILADMNISVDWIPVLESHGWESVHWSEVGDLRAADAEIMSWALANNFVVFTHDLDFGALLAVTHAQGPSVVQMRAQDIMPIHMEASIVAALHQYEPLLEQGALISIDPNQARARVLPINK